MEKYRYTVDPLLKVLAAYALILFLLVLMVCLSGCGTRKKSGETTKTSDQQTEKSKSEGSVSKDSGSTQENSSKEKDHAAEQHMKQVITELYDENGKLKSRITSLEKQNYTATSTKDEKSRKTQYNRVDSVFNVTNYKHVVITTYKDKENIDSDKRVVTNLGGSWVLIVVVIIIVGAAFLYFYLRKR